MAAYSIPLGHFRLVEPIGSGGMGEVWRGVHVTQNVPVAVKVVTAARGAALGGALRNEVRSVARLHHSNIIMLFDHGLIDDDAAKASDSRLVAGSPEFAMELVTGGTLDVSSGPIPWATLRRSLLAILNALAHAHARGVIHRDLKPSNVLVSRTSGSRRGLKLTDFGIAHALDASDAAHRDERISGTLRYMAPEQIAGSWRDEGPWTDLYALGMIAYCMATGQRAYGDTSGEQLVHCHLHAPVPEIDDAGLPDGFSGWTQRMVAKRPANRFERAADAAWALLQLGLEAQPRVAGVPQAHAPMMPTSRFARWADAEADVDASGAPSDSRQDAPADPRERTAETPSSRSIAALRRWTTDEVLVDRPTRPATPSTYERTSSSPTSMRLVGAGLALYGLRPIPMVGRTHERTILWSALRDVSDSGKPRVIALGGAAGCGKSRIIEWIGQRAHEVGAATVVHAVHSPIAGPADGLAHAVAYELKCVGLERARVESRCARYVEEHPLPDDSDEDPAALAELIAPGDDGDRVRLATPADRYRVIRRLLERMCVRRPAILWVDDVQWGADALGFTEFVLAADRTSPLPLLIVLTVRTAALADRAERQQLDQLLGHSAAGHLDIPPLPRDEHTQLVERLLGLSSSLTADVATRTHGNPLFAVQLIGDWVDRGVLSVGEAGFELQRGESALIPDDIHHLWSDRIDTILNELDLGDRESATRALEIAAALGHRVVIDEWMTACRRAGVRIPNELVELLLAHRLGVPFDGDWSFTHGMLRESLERRARDANRWPDHHRACAAMLADRYPDDEVGIQDRRGRHLVVAGDLAAAVAPLFAGAEQRRLAGDFRRAHALYDELEHAMTDLALPGADPRWGQIWTHRARACVSQGQLDQAEALTSRASGRAAIHGWQFVTAWVAALEGHIAFARGEPDTSRDRFEHAVELFRATDDQRGLADALIGLGRVSMWLRVLEPANASYQEAYDLHKRSGDMYELGVVLRGLAGLRHCEADLVGARQLLERASSCFEHSGNRLEIANCLNDLGELARARSDLPTAEDLYARAGQLYASLGCPDASTPHFNLGLVLLERGRYADARARFETERALLGAEQRSIDMLWLDAGLLTCAAADRAWDEYDDLLRSVERLLKGFVDEDIPWCASRAAELAATAGESARARAAWRVARGQWKLLGRDERVVQIDEALDRLA